MRPSGNITCIYGMILSRNNGRNIVDWYKSMQPATVLVAVEVAKLELIVAGLVT